MIDLTRTVRFFLLDGDADPPPRHNSFAGWPPPRGLCPYFELQVCCRGQVDPVTGYFMNIKAIDQAVREHGLACLQAMTREAPSLAAVPLGTLMRRLIACLQPPLGDTVRRVRLSLSPFHHLTIGSSAMDHVTIAQKYEFCAAHRLHAEQLSEQDNREVFGKCNNPSGHGHNYQVQVSVQAPVLSDGHTLAVEQLDALVDAAVIQKFDHKHLNIDLPEFAALNPSVENIARVIHGILEKRVEQLGVKLATVSVWETGKTQCTYGQSEQDLTD